MDYFKTPHQIKPQRITALSQSEKRMPEKTPEKIENNQPITTSILPRTDLETKIEAEVIKTRKPIQ